jgi:hypothetical protein
MAKFYGIIGFAETVETSPGVWEDVITRRSYSGDVVKSAQKYKSSDRVNSNVVIDNDISIISDIYANNKINLMKYIEFMGIKWKIESVEIRYPRLIISIGDVYNE